MLPVELWTARRTLGRNPYTRKPPREQATVEDVCVTAALENVA